MGGLTSTGAAAAVGGVVASGGMLAGAIVAAGLAGGSGALFGATLARSIGERHDEELRAQIDSGGPVLVGVDARCRPRAAGGGDPERQ